MNEIKSLYVLKKIYISMGAQIRGTWPHGQLDFVRRHLIFSAITAADFPLINKYVDQFTRTKQNTPENSKVLSSCGLSVQNLLLVAFPVLKSLSGFYTVWASVDPCA